jgi:chromosome segregation ATPase
MSEFTYINAFVQGQVGRLKEHIEKFQEDLKNVQTREYTALEKLKKCERNLRESKDDIMRLTQRESDLQSRRINLEKQLENADLEISTLKVDLT